MTDIKHRFSGKVLYTSEKETVKEVLIEAVSKAADLEGADLEGAYLDSEGHTSEGQTSGESKSQ